MSAITVNHQDNEGAGSYAKWASVSNADTCNSIRPAGHGPIAGAIQFTGTAGAVSVALHGSVDGTNFAALKDVNGTAIALTTAGEIAEFSTACRSIKPVPTGGGGTQDIDIHINMRG